MLDLQAHDFPSDGDELAAHTVTQAKWKKEVWDIGVGGSVYGVDGRTLICQKSGSPLLCLTNASRLASAYNTLSPTYGSIAGDPFGVRMNFAHALGQEKWGRSFFLNERFQLRQPGEVAHHFLLLSPHGWGAWWDIVVSPTQGTSSERRAEFLWSLKDELVWLYDATPSQIMGHIVNQLNDAESDINFSRRWLTLSSDERRDLVWCCQRGKTAELERVAKMALLAQEELWRRETELAWLILLDQNAHIQSKLYAEGDRTSPSALEGALEQIIGFFNPQPDANKIQRHLYLRLSYSHNISVEAENPSAHERLEAILGWRDWLAANTIP